MREFWDRLKAEEVGATTMEYALMVALIGAAMAAVVTALGTSISSKFASTSNRVSGAGS